MKSDNKMSVGIPRIEMDKTKNAANLKFKFWFVEGLFRQETKTELEYNDKRFKNSFFTSNQFSSIYAKI